MKRILLLVLFASLAFDAEAQRIGRFRQLFVGDGPGDTAKASVNEDGEADFVSVEADSYTLGGVAFEPGGPDGTTNNSVQRYDSGTDAWVEEPDVQVTSGGDLTVKGGTVDVGVANTQYGRLRLRGGASTAFDVLLYNDDANDTNVTHWRLYGSSGYFVMESGGGASGLGTIYSVSPTDGKLSVSTSLHSVGALTSVADSNLATTGGDVQIGTSDSTTGVLHLYGGSSTTGGLLRLYNGDSNDATYNYGELQLQGDYVRMNFAGGNTGIHRFYNDGTALHGISDSIGGTLSLQGNVGNEYGGIAAIYNSAQSTYDDTVDYWYMRSRYGDLSIGATGGTGAWGDVFTFNDANGAATFNKSPLKIKTSSMAYDYGDIMAEDSLVLGGLSLVSGNLYYEGAWKYHSNNPGWYILSDAARGGVAIGTAATNASGAGAAATTGNRMYISGTSVDITAPLDASNTANFDGNITINANTTDGDASTDVHTMIGRFLPRSVTDGSPMSTSAGTEKEILWNTTDEKWYGSYETGTPASWTPFQTGLERNLLGGGEAHVLEDNSGGKSVTYYVLVPPMHRGTSITVHTYFKIATEVLSTQAVEIDLFAKSFDAGDTITATSGWTQVGSTNTVNITTGYTNETLIELSMSGTVSGMAAGEFLGIFIQRKTGDTYTDSIEMQQVEVVWN